jgi:hypothetical protein
MSVGSPLSAAGAPALIFGLVAAIQSIELHDRHLWVGWGTIPDWFAAVGTVFAAIGVSLVTASANAPRLTDADRLS